MWLRSLAPVGGYHLAVPGAWWLWCIFFAYSSLATLLIQLVVLPYILPAIHDKCDAAACFVDGANGTLTTEWRDRVVADGPQRAELQSLSRQLGLVVSEHAMSEYVDRDPHGHGLLIEGDWVYHNRRGIELAHRVHTEGWSTWRLRPGDEHALHGIVSAVYVATLSEPWTLIPLHAALHATSALVLMWIAAIFVPSRRHALLAALPFLLFPSAMVSYAQISKDVYTICGGFLFLYGWLLLVQSRTRWPGWRVALTVIALILGGTTLSWTMRPFIVYFHQTIATLFAIVLSARNLADVWRGSAGVRGLTASAGAWSVVLLLIVPFNVAGMLAEPRTGHRYYLQDATERPLASDGDVESFWMPGVLRDALYSVSEVRRRWVGNKGNSTIDLSFMPEDATDMLGYLPRAMAVGFLSPFPWHWVRPGSFSSTTLMRKIVGVEMLLVYVAWLSLAVVAWLWRSRIELWMIFVYSLVNILVWTLATPNLGSLYRVKYGPMMLLVGVALACGAAALSERRLAGPSTGQSP